MSTSRKILLLSRRGISHRRHLARCMIGLTGFVLVFIEGIQEPTWGQSRKINALEPGEFPSYIQTTKIEKPSCLRKARRGSDVKECSSIFEGTITEKRGKDKYEHYIKGSFLYSKIRDAKPEAVWTLRWHYDYKKEFEFKYGWPHPQNFPGLGTVYKCIYHNKKSACY